VHSLCPNIYGHEIIKAGLILSLFGGTVKRMQLREDIHILLVGDPGLGKSQMLQACARISTKGIREKTNNFLILYIIYKYFNILYILKM